MESRAHEIKVGIFTLGGIVLFCLSIILLGGDRMFLTKTYDLKVRLKQVQGLNSGSVVSVSGLQVGNIKKIEFIPGSHEVEVTLKVEQQVQDRITEGSVASVKTQGALGDKYIYIEPGKIGGTPLKEGSLIETDKTPDFIDIIAAKGAEMGEIVDVVKEVKILLQNINRDNRSANMMTNLVNATDSMNRFMVEGRETFRILRTDTLVPLASVMKKIDSGYGTLGALVNDPSLHSRLSSFLGETPRNKFLAPLIRNSIQTSEDKK